MLKRFICPDGVEVDIKACYAGCRIAAEFPLGRCMPLHILQALGKERRLTGFSTTEILSPTRLQMLMKLTDYAEAPEERLWALFGSAVHSVFEEDADEHLSELRLQGSHGESGAFDVYDGTNKVLSDLKYTGGWKIRRIETEGIMHGDHKNWALQLNRYRQKLEEVGLEVRKMVLFLVQRDYGFMDAKKGYKRTVQIEVPRLDDQVLNHIFDTRLAMLKKAIEEKYAPVCSEEERWEGRRCEKYCPVKEACIALCKERGEKHPVFG